MKPFAVEDKTGSGDVFVAGWRFKKFGEQLMIDICVNGINAAFESRLKEEMERFRERAIDKVFEFRDGDDDTAAQRTAYAIRAMPLFETEEKP